LSVPRFRRLHALCSVLLLGAAADFPPEANRHLEALGCTPVDVEEFSRPPDQVFKVTCKTSPNLMVKKKGGTLYAQQRLQERGPLAAKLGLSPKLHVAEETLQVAQWVEGKPLDQVPPSLFQSLKKLHDSPVTETKFPEIYTIGQRCLERLKAFPPMPVLQKHLETLEALFVPQDPRIIHGDLHPGNIVVDAQGQLFFLDWGDSVVSSLLDDLGAIAFYYDLAPEDVLRRYWGRDPTAEDVQQLELKMLQTKLHIALWLLWHTQDVDPAPDFCWKTFWQKHKTNLSRAPKTPETRAFAEMALQEAADRIQAISISYSS